jgi:hypothetical protein
MIDIERQRVGPLPVWGWALVSSAFVLGLYVITLAPTTAFWDTSEYIATAWIVGIPHPPGNALFVMVGRAWAVLLGWTGLSVAVRINLLSAVASAATAGLWFLAVARIWAHFTEDRKQLVIAAAVSVLVSATAFTVWSQSNVNEKVYTISLFFVALVTYLTMVWEDFSDTRTGDRILILIAFLLGLGATNHQMSLMPIPALGMFILWHRWKTLLNWRVLVGGLTFAIVGFSVQLLFVPIRSAQNPVIDEADPQCENILEAVTPTFNAYLDDDGNPVRGVKCLALAQALNREQYKKPPLSERQSPIGAQFRMYFQYFDWQWARTLRPGPRLFITLVFTALGILGLVRHFKGDRDSFIYFVVLLLTLTVVLVYYLNFKYGYSLYPDVFPLTRHEVRERDYFYLLSFNVWGMYAGMGVAVLWQRIARRGGGKSVDYRRASPLLAIAVLPLVFNWQMANRRGDYSARDWAYNMLQSVEPYGIIFTNGDNDTFPLWYMQEVEGIRRDVTVIVHSYLGTKWYPKQLRELTTPCPPDVDPLATPTVIVCQRPFDEANAVLPYEGSTPGRPTRTILPLTDEQIERLPMYAVVDQDTTVSFGGAVEGFLPERTVITHPDILVLYIIRSALGDRPIYFASTAPPVYQIWNLQPHLIRQGLAHKLAMQPIESTTDTVPLREEFDVTWIDRARSQQLLWGVYQIDYLTEWDFWREPSTRSSIPTQYYLAYFALAEADRLRGDVDGAEASYQRAERLLELSNVDLR